MDPFTIKEIAEAVATESSGEVPSFQNSEINLDDLQDSYEIGAEDFGDEIPDFEDGKNQEKSENFNEKDSQEKTEGNTNDVEKNQEIQELKEDYIKDIVNNSEVPETIDVEKAISAQYEKCTPEETAIKREDFDRNKNTLIEQWEEQNGQQWPTYQEDVYSSNGHLIRHAGDKYDAHHIQPLSMGGENEASNITPLRAECHYDRQGVHAPDSAYAKLEQKLGE